MSYRDLTERFVRVLSLDVPPIAITFTDDAPDGVERFDEPMSEPAPDGRQGRVPAGCVFWMKATDRTFVTTPEDHGNCSVGSLTHGLASIDEVSGNDDVAAVLSSGWVTMDMIPKIPTVSERPGAITYGPLTDTPVDPDVVLLRVDPRQMMVLHDAVPEMDLGGKPQCHIVAVAKERQEVAASVGCALSRARTGMKPTEMTCAIPGAKLDEILTRLEETTTADKAVANYAAEDKRRFS